MSKQRKTVVRMLGQAVQIVYGPVGTGMSGIEPDESALDARRLLKKLQRLANKDPDNKFDVCYARLQLKLIKAMWKSKH